VQPCVNLVLTLAATAHTQTHTGGGVHGFTNHHGQKMPEQERRSCFSTSSWDSDRLKKLQERARAKRAGELSAVFPPTRWEQILKGKQPSQGEVHNTDLKLQALARERAAAAAAAATKSPQHGR
jgi:hypothetical protein